MGHGKDKKDKKKVDKVKDRCVMDNKLAEKVIKIWKAAFPDAVIVPGIGFPDDPLSQGVLTITNSTDTKTFQTPDIKINGLSSKSALVNNGIFSSECSKGKYLNLYDVVLPDIPGKDGHKSTVQVYIDELQKLGIQVSGISSRWTGTDVNALFVNSYNIGLDPREFSERTVVALLKAMAVVQRRSQA